MLGTSDRQKKNSFSPKNGLIRARDSLKIESFDADFFSLSEWIKTSSRKKSFSIDNGGIAPRLGP
jgi:hypothetical protein